MAGDHWAAARLRHVADQNPVPAVLAGVGGELLDIGDELRRAPVPVPRRPHHLPARAGERQRRCAGKTPFGIRANGLGRAGRRGRDLREQLLGGQVVDRGDDSGGERDGGRGNRRSHHRHMTRNHSPAPQDEPG